MLGLARVSSRYIFLRLILFPGVVVHELAHVAACIVTGTPIQNISFWTETGGEVVHHKPKYAVVTQPFISFAPFPVGIGLLLLLSHYIRQVEWGIAAVILFLMVSIAATLAPSKTDAIHAIEGSIVLIGILIAIAFAVPEYLQRLIPSISQFNQQMGLVAIILAIMWASLFLLHRTIRHISR